MNAEEFGNYIKEIRKERNLTIRQTEDLSGVSNAYLSQIENGKRGIPSPQILKKLSKAYNYSYTELLKNAGYLFGNKVTDALIEQTYTLEVDTQLRFIELIDNLQKQHVDEKIIANELKTSTDYFDLTNDSEQKLLQNPYKNKEKIVENVSLSQLTLMVGILQGFLSTLNKDEEFDLEKALQGKKLKWGDEVLNEDERKKAIELMKIMFDFKQDT